MQIEAVLFDIDGTLVDSNEQHVAAWVTAFEEAGFPQQPESIRAQIGKGGDLLVPFLLPDVADPIREQIAERHGSRFKERYLGDVRAFPRATELLEKVHSTGRKVVLASSAKGEELEHYVDLLGIGDLLAAATSIDDVETSKPAPDIFSAALQKIGVGGEHSVVVGDTPYDVEAARKAGIAAVGLTSGPFSRDQLTLAGAIAVYADVADLLTRLDESPLLR